MNNSVKTMQTLRRLSQSLCIVLLLLSCYALSAQNEVASRSEHCSGPRCMGRWFRLERRLPYSGQGWLQRQHRQEPETSFKDDVAATKRILAHKMDHAFWSPTAMGER